MAAEIESKYVCKYIPDNAKHPTNIKQGYIHIDKIKQVRIRLKNREAILCVKYMDGNYRDEFEAVLPYTEGEKLYSLCKYKVEKRRWQFVTQDGCHCDLDLYPSGVMVVEIERPTVDYKPILPDCVGECVDGVYKYTNYYLAGLQEDLYK